MFSRFQKKTFWKGTALAVLSLWAGLSLISCPGPNDPVSSPANAAQPGITNQPQGGTWNVEDDETFELKVTASKSDNGILSYQWYSNTTNSNTGGTTTGTNSDTLTLNKTDYTENGTRYFYVVVTNTNKKATKNKTAGVTSNVAPVQVNVDVDVDGNKLTNGVWRDGELTDTISSLEYTFDVESGKTYYVWWNGSIYGSTPKAKTMDVSVSAMYSGETDYIFGGAGFDAVNANWLTPQFFTAGETGSVTVIVTPYSDHTTFGTFAVAYSTVSIRPGAAVAKTITANQWADATIATDDIHVYTINVTEGTEYRVWWNERGSNGDDTKTADVEVQARYADDTIIFNDVNTGYADQWSATAWAAPKTFTAGRTGTVDLRVRPYSEGIASPGTYGIVYSTGGTRPLKDSATLMSVAANGGSGTPTTALTLTFDEVVSGLSAGDITLAKSGLFGVTKGALSGNGPSYTLGVSSPTDGTVTVTVGGVLLQITGSPKDVTIYADAGSVTPLVEDQWADGDLPEGSSVDWYKITVTAGTTYYVWWNDSWGGDDYKTADVVVSAWNANETDVFGGDSYTGGEDSGWDTPQSFNAAANGTVYVRVMPYKGDPDYIGTYGVVYSTVNSRPAVKHPDDTPVTLNSVTADGSAGTATTALTLTFSGAVTGLSADDITLSGILNVTKGDLNGNGPIYTLGVSSPADGTLTVTVTKRGYDISGARKEVNVYGSGGVTATPLVAGQWVNGTLSEGDSVDWYTITVTAGTTYRIWWNDCYEGPETKNKTGDVVVSAWNANETNIFGGDESYGGEDSGWDTPQLFTPLANGTVYVKVMPWYAIDSCAGTYGIVFTANNATRPAVN